MKYALYIGLLLMSSCAIAQKGNRKAAENHFMAALKAYGTGNNDEALQMLKKSLKADPGFGSAWSLQAEIAEIKKDTALASKSYQACVRYEPLFQNHCYFYARYCFRQGRYAEALTWLARFNNLPSMPEFDPKKDAASKRNVVAAEKLAESCKLAQEDKQRIEDLDIRNLGPGVNSANNEYWPGMTVDGTTLIFTRLVQGQEDFYISEKSENDWLAARPLPGRINTSNNEGYTSISADGRFIFFSVCNQDGFGSCDIFYSYLNGNNWSQRFNLGEKVNGVSWDAQPAISADGKTLIFSSSRPGGFGGKDLWITRWTKAGWSSPENLGNTVNTPEDEEAPYLHYDNKTLYFSSSGHTGYGMHDIFRSQWLANGQWTNPENMGKGINTEADEAGFYVDFRGELAYIASSRSGGYGSLDIYSLKLGEGKKPLPVTYVKGNILDAETKLAITGRIELINLESKKTVLLDSAQQFFTTLETHGSYALNVYRNGYLFYSANVTPTPASIDSPFLVTAFLKPIKLNERVVLNNIFFETDKYALRPESTPELDKLTQLMKNNPAMKVEISGHTDNQGSESHNLTLSQNRALSVKQYLIKYGIPEIRISTKGFGDKLPVATNDTDAGRAKNRRIELTVTGL